MQDETTEKVSTDITDTMALTEEEKEKEVNNVGRW